MNPGRCHPIKASFINLRRHRTLNCFFCSKHIVSTTLTEG